MADLHDDSSEFEEEKVQNVIRHAITSALDTTKEDQPKEFLYNPKKVNEWTNSIIAQCLKSLNETGPKPFKFIVTCMIMQDTGAGINTTTSMYWDASKDGYCKVNWENGTMKVLVTVYGLSVNIDDPADD